MKRKMRRWLAVLLVFALTFSMASTDVLAAGVAMAQEAVGESVAPSALETMLETEAENKLTEESVAAGEAQAAEEAKAVGEPEEAKITEEAKAVGEPEEAQTAEATTEEAEEAKGTESSKESEEISASEEMAETGEPTTDVGSGEGTNLPKMRKKSALRSATTSGIVFSEDFEDKYIVPEGWKLERIKDAVTWTRSVWDDAESSRAHSGLHCASLVDWDAVNDGLSAWLITPAYDFSNVTGTLKLSFWYENSDKNGAFDELCVGYRVGRGEWRELFRTTQRTKIWTKQILILPEDAKRANVEIGFCGTNHCAWGVDLDDVVLEIAESVQTHSVTYNANGGSGTMTDSNNPYLDGSYVTALQNAFQAPAGRGFVRWNTKADGRGISYEPNDYFELTQDVTLYAQWGYPISVSGAITDGRVYCGRSAALAGETISLGVYSFDFHYVLKKLTVRSGNEIIAVTKVDEEKYTFVMPEGGVEIEATFQMVDVAFYEDFTDVAGWTFVDADGDNDGWYIPSYSFIESRLTSDSYKQTADGQTVAVRPDNWAITPAIELPDNPFLTFEIIRSYVGSKDQNMAVYVGHSPSVNAMTKVGGDFTGDGRYAVDLSAYAGQTVYVGFRHYNNVTDNIGGVSLMNVTVYGDDLGTIDRPGIVRSYSELKEKINEANNGNSVDYTYLKLTRDITTDEVDAIDIGKTDKNLPTCICLDLAGHTITSTASVNDFESSIFRLKHGDLIIEDNVGGGGIQVRNIYNVFLFDNDEKPCYLAVYDGTFSNRNEIIGGAKGNATIEIYGGRFQSVATSSISIGLSKTQFTPKLTIRGGVFKFIAIGYGDADLRDCTIEGKLLSAQSDLGSCVNPNSRVVLNGEVVTDLSVRKMEGTIVIEDKNKLRFVMQPQDQTCREGEGVTFVARAENATGYYWYVEDENGKRVSAVDKGWASGSSYNYVPNGAGGTTFSLTGIKEGLEGKKVYCVAEGNGQLVESARAEISFDKKVREVCVQIENLEKAVIGANVRDFMTAKVLNSQGKVNPHASATVSWYPAGSNTQVTDHVFGPYEKWDVYVKITLADGYEFTDDATCRVLNVNGETVTAIRGGQSQYDPTWALFDVRDFVPQASGEWDKMIAVDPFFTYDRYFPGQAYIFIWTLSEKDLNYGLAEDAVEFTFAGNTDAITVECEMNALDDWHALRLTLGDDEEGELITVVATYKADPSQVGYYFMEVTQAPKAERVTVSDYGSQTGETSFMVSWTAPELLKEYPQSHFILYRKEADGGWRFADVQAYDENVASYRYYDNEVTAGVKYQYAVVCTDRGYHLCDDWFWPSGYEAYDWGKPAYSQPVTARAAAPLQLKNVTVTQEGRALRISWDECVGATSYRIAKVSAETPPNFWAASDFTELVSGLTDCTYLDEDVREGMTYGYWVYAVNKDGETAESSLNARKRKVTVQIVSMQVTFKHNIEFDNNIAMHYIVPQSELQDCSNLKLLIDKAVYAEGAAAPTVQQFVLENPTPYEVNGVDYWHFTFPGISASEMGNALSAKVQCVKEGVTYESQADVYSVREYAYARLAKTSSASYKKVLVDMLNYGAAAQTHFKKNAANPVNAGLTDEQKAFGTSLEGFSVKSAEKVISLNGATASFDAKNLVFGSNVELVYRMDFSNFKKDAPVGTTEAEKMANVKVVFTYDNGKGEKTLTVPYSKFTTNGGKYVASCSVLTPAEMGCTVNATIYDGNVPVSDTLQYSIESYVYNRLSGTGSSSETFKELLKRMVLYGRAVKEHFK